MVNNDLLKRVNRGRLLGLKYSELKDLLIKKGYSDEQINEAILVHFKKVNKYSVPKKIAHELSKKSKKFAEKMNVKFSEMPKVKVVMPEINIPKIRMPVLKIPKFKFKIPSIKLPKLKLNIPKLNFSNIIPQKSAEKTPIKRNYKKPVRKVKTISEKPEIKTIEVKKPIKRVVIKDPSRYFYFCNQKSAKNMPQFIAAVKKLNDEEFKHHVNSDKNDFYNWVNDVVGDKELAEKLKDKTEKSQILDVLKR